MTRQQLTNLTLSLDDSGVYRIALNVPGRPMNVLNESVMAELEQAVNELETRSDVKLVVFKSTKESGFLAGADVEAIEAIESADHAERLMKQGQQLFDRIDHLPMPTLAVLHGPCLGGGLELALACDYRVARDNSSTKIGLPEIKLGLIPGWGGTQRLPKLVGLKESLSMILSGKHLSACDAMKIGLVDRAIQPDQWRDEIVRVIDTLAGGGSLRRKLPGAAALWRLIERIPQVRGHILSLTQKRLAGKSKHYPALTAAIHAIVDGYDAHADGFETERREFCDLIDTPTCRQLLRLFFSRERARNLKTWTPHSLEMIHGDPIRTLGVIGGGAMGAGIAQAAAIRGYAVHVKEVDADAASQGSARIDRLVADYGRHKKFGADQVRELRDRINIGTDFDALADVDCVVEAVVERMQVKQSVLADVEKAVRKSAILATNTSSLSVTEMAASLSRPSQFAGLHFFNPVHRMELVEVVRGDETSDATIAQLVSLVRALGKTPIVTTDSPGFLVNRILFPYLGEAIMMVREGHSIAVIDREMRDFGMPMGPLQLLDHVGLDVALHVARSLGAVMRDVDDVVDVLSPLARRNEIGLKSKRGFYDYRGKKPQPRETAEVVDFIVEPARPERFLTDGLSDIQRRLVYLMMGEAIRCEERRVVEHAWAIDLAMVLGTGFAPHRGGPLAVVDQIGTQTVLDNMERLHAQYGDRFTPPASLQLGAKQ
ncbi:3-hydroxyacyl-CoA dehydrogenase NAD-binding domain-containing protein [Rhodopirellula sp. JC639]|uniref:3-hydroxyacyl-CoA dehydrogenase NAD-binding domain-containing protein n=1 Tax=Stieleria mannarensis TaxID=2755585 RepID=UPI0016040AE9|nr:3-hydroxyacyl-CoA dehydrogenase NAD-binding domain-containing protein [Rhodopirellula sp. JC639]